MVLRGATGPCSAKVNGTDVLTTERLNGKLLYAKEGDNDKWLFLRKDGMWCAGATSKELAENASNAGYAQTEAGLAHPTVAKAWKVYDDGWEAQQVEVTIVVSHILDI